MPRNGSGIYSLPAGSIVTDGVDDILATQHNTPLQDLESDMNEVRPIVAGGTGASSASAARTALGLGSIATQEASAVAITGGTMTGATVGMTSGSAAAPAVFFDASTTTGIFRVADDTLGIATAGAERMRVNANGSVLIGTTNVAPGETNTDTGTVISGVTFRQLISVSNNIASTLNRNTSDGTIQSFRREGVQVGTVSVTGSATAYNTSSDERIKENIAPAGDPGAIIDGLDIVQFDFTANGDHVRFGVTAQQAHDHFPEMVTVGAEGDFWQVDHSKAVPMMIRELQLLRARVAALEAV
jgi:hypothetical protein